jgi:hypothetical protein
LTVLRLSELTQLKSEDDKSSFGAMASASDISRVVLWDVGPSRPIPPSRPKPPKGAEGDPEFDLAKLEFRDELEAYDEALRRYKKQREDFKDFETRWGGPHEISMWSADARDALTNDARAVAERRQDAPRYFMSSRTRGSENLANSGLPPKMSPGRGHEAEMERLRQSGVDLRTMQRRDPVFGEQRTMGS